MKFENLNIGDYVQICSPGNAWDGLYGIVDEISKQHEIAFLVCVAFPCYRYEVTPWNLHEIRKVNF